tara:strand:- start:2370 stop:2606 length:237 start_codon:yes stop_codon:yes gene_type:complete
MKSSESSDNPALISEELLETLSKSKLILKYMQNKILPSIDELLDRRLLVKEMDDEGLLTKHWLEAEILAVDFLLSKHK